MTQLLFVGSLDERKGLQYLLEAMPKIQQNYDVKLKVVGIGPKEKKFKSLAGSNVEFLGGVWNEVMPSLYQQSDIFILPSQNEGVPVSILEAMSCGVPVIATYVGGIPEIIEHRETGFLIYPRPEYIASAVSKLLDDRELYDRLSANGRKLIVESYDWKAVVDNFRNVIVFDSIDS